MQQNAHLVDGGGDDRSARQKLYERLLGCKAKTPEDAYQDGCDAWREWSRASMVCLWLHNRLSDQFELNAISKLDACEGYSSVPICGPTSLCAFVATTAEPLMVTNASAWSAQANKNKVFKATTAAELERKGLPVSVCVPMLASDFDQAGSEAPRTEGVVSIHYKSLSDVPESLRFDRPSDEPFSFARKTSLLLIGRLTAMLIAKLRLDQQVALAMAISRLIDEHLTRFDHDPKMVRRDFLDGLIGLLKKHLGIQAFSIFWRVPFADSLSCIATTGLVRLSDARQLHTKAEQSMAFYDIPSVPSPAEPWTVQVFRSGEYRLCTAEEVKDHASSALYTETIKGQPIHGAGPVLPSPVLLAPLPWRDPGKKKPDQNDKVLGVLRCGHMPSQKFVDQLRNFDAVEVHVLRFVVDQVTPVLHTLESRIAREDAISIVKHDMDASIVGIRDAVKEIESQLGRRFGEDRSYTLENLQESALALRGLTDRLSRGHDDRVQVRPKKTNLESDIVARLKRMLTPFAQDSGGMDIRFDGLNQIPALNIDRELIERALYNLLVNAIKYGERNSVIKIVGKKVDSGYAVDVENRGSGIEDADVPYLFRMYFRSRHAEATRAGSGLGLSIVRQIMRSHGGDVVLAQARNPTIIRLLFPVSREA